MSKFTIDSIKSKRFFRALFWIIRISMGLTFIISGFRKMPGIKFTILSVENPVGHYFEAMHATGFYWNFIGVFQILIGILIFFRRFVVMSSLLMMPVTVNIFLISIALQMQGTPVITSLMLLGNIYLLLWHYKNYNGIIDNPR